MINDYDGKSWYKDDVLHRDNGLPAIELNNGAKQWFVNGLRHRDNDLPAIELANGAKQWFVNGKRHRESGPAVESFGDKEWWINGQELNQEQFSHYLEMKKLNEQLHQDLTINNSKTKPPKI